jgi:diguanylate cyclase (GGDEF)-like protein/PAS domain S-box-containing protein
MSDPHLHTPSFGIGARLTSQLAAQTLQSIGDAVICVDLAAVIIWMNPGAERLLARSEADSVGRPLADVLHLRANQGGAMLENVAARVLRAQRPVDLPSGVVLQRHDGTIVPIGDSASPIRDVDGQMIGVVVVLRDESEQRRVGDRLAFEANHDALTGLPNRRAFEAQLARLSRSHAVPPVGHALLLMDLDHFKAVNDRAGHAAGDALLQAIGPAVAPLLRGCDMFARIGGDEFAILLADCSLSMAEAVAGALRSALRRLSTLPRSCWHGVDASIGVCPFSSNEGAPADLLRAADRACYAAKAAGRGRVFTITSFMAPVVTPSDRPRRALGHPSAV